MNGPLTIPSPLDARALKQVLDLPTLAQARYGLRLRRSGRQYLSLCCFHAAATSTFGIQSENCRRAIRSPQCGQ